MADEEMIIKISADTSGVEDGAKKAAKSLDSVKKGSSSLQGVMGNMSSAIDSLNVNFGGWGVNIGQARNAIGKMIPSLKGATTSLKTFKIALAATGIGAIVIALGTLISAFLSTEKGADTLAKIMEPLKAAFGALWGLIQRLSTGIFTKIFEDPLQAAKDLGKAIFNNIINRISGFVGLIETLVTSVVLAFKDMGASIKVALADVPLLGRGIDKDQAISELTDIRKAAQDNAKKMANEFGKAMTGVDNVWKKIGDGAEQVSKEMKAGADIGRQIKEIDDRIMENKISQARETSKLNREMSEGRQIANDSNKSQGERQKGLEMAQKASARLRDLESAQQKLLIEKAHLQNSINDTSDEDYLKQVQIEAKLDDINADYANREKMLGRISDRLKNQSETEKDIEQAVSSAQSAYKGTRTEIESMEDSIQEVKNLIDQGVFEKLDVDGQEVLNRLQEKLQEIKTSDAKGLFNSTLTSAEQLQIKIQQTKQLIDEGVFDKLGINGQEVLARLTSQMEGLNEKTKDVGSSLKSGLQQGLQSVFETGEKMGPALLKMIKQLALRLAAAAISAKIISILFPGAGIAAGVIGGGVGAVKSAISPPPMAKGGMAVGEGLRLLGDNPSGKEAVIPFERMTEFARKAMPKGGGGAVTLDGEFRIRGGDLLLLLQREIKTNAR